MVRNCCVEEQVLSINFGSAPRIADAIAQEPGQESMCVFFFLYLMCSFFFFSWFALWLFGSFIYSFRDACDHVFSSSAWRLHEPRENGGDWEKSTNRSVELWGIFLILSLHFLIFFLHPELHWTAFADFLQVEGCSGYKLDGFSDINMLWGNLENWWNEFWSLSTAWPFGVELNYEYPNRQFIRKYVSIKFFCSPIANSYLEKDLILGEYESHIRSAIIFWRLL